MKWDHSLQGHQRAWVLLWVAVRAVCGGAGDLFEIVIGTERVPIVVIIGVVSMLYTAYGGLYVSIVTDQWQVRLRAPVTACLGKTWYLQESLDPK